MERRNMENSGGRCETMGTIICLPLTKLFSTFAYVVRELQRMKNDFIGGNPCIV
ncbi:hypothetical protein C8R41DRAFT_823332 [Lentinula lateritia]|uniref:Uncharacterized protein n=1 Tax=Lentinula lateritia TaxID=40482 RepID=A0ABQ8VCJ6_9AGAR|nr:hypothetical protein C8R41DRAFT_839396 [Lentinula lateritia]KAJ4497120.1 hypothetical protein C8R41DRAFT_823332 [Lentinula lateritia]